LVPELDSENVPLGARSKETGSSKPRKMRVALAAKWKKSCAQPARMDEERNRVLANNIESGEQQFSRMHGDIR
jgi:hypothetical protein